MIYGTGAPIAKLTDESGAIAVTLTLPRPTRREANGFEDAVANLGTDADGNAVEDYLGVRYHGKYIWLSHAANQSDMATVQRLANWRGDGYYVLLVPHSEQTLQIRCQVTRAGERPRDGKVTEEEITIELWGVDLLAKRPNPTYDRVRMVWRRGRIAA